MNPDSGLVERESELTTVGFTAPGCWAAESGEDISAQCAKQLGKSFVGLPRRRPVTGAQASLGRRPSTAARRLCQHWPRGGFCHRRVSPQEFKKIDRGSGRTTAKHHLVNDRLLKSFAADMRRGLRSASRESSAVP